MHIVDHLSHTLSPVEIEHTMKDFAVYICDYIPKVYALILDAHALYHFTLCSYITSNC